MGAGSLLLLAVAGCTLNKSELRRDNILTRVCGSGQVIEREAVRASRWRS